MGDAGEGEFGVGEEADGFEGGLFFLLFGEGFEEDVGGAQGEGNAVAGLGDGLEECGVGVDIALFPTDAGFDVQAEGFGIGGGVIIKQVFNLGTHETDFHGATAGPAELGAVIAGGIGLRLERCGIQDAIGEAVFAFQDHPSGELSAHVGSEIFAQDAGDNGERITGGEFFAGTTGQTKTHEAPTCGEIVTSRPADELAPEAFGSIKTRDVMQTPHLIAGEIDDPTDTQTHGTDERPLAGIGGGGIFQFFDTPQNLCGGPGLRESGMEIHGGKLRGHLGGNLWIVMQLGEDGIAGLGQNGRSETILQMHGLLAGGPDGNGFDGE